ncbi:VWA domain-containing protein [Candidatus Nitrosocosmicus arcticus]|uniref:Putative von Willebrand factor type A n=1 Tax=Candidatus Nitrosocosmicus arcticus TaxID=2035267 RepID=A0A557SUH9_9ARCH|nr:VWA domain-containing protein [Candidatus Nitrosocosmicus arcticus]TVP40255.1 putative von Willebrand factor type A [Candidatus Nitrosocosmicus arcticus]
MSIFWNIKDNGNNSRPVESNDQYNDESSDKKVKSKVYKKRSESFLRFDDLDLENIHIRNDVLLEIATFLSRRWSDNSESTIHISRDGKISTNLDKKRITLPGLDYFFGNIFQKYRQWRTLLWYESVRLKYSFKIFDTDVVFGFVFNILETKRIEILGLEEWKGMIKEIIYCEGLSWHNKLLLNSLHGKNKVLEAFSQFFLTGYIKGELYGGENERVINASEYAHGILRDYIKNFKLNNKTYDPIKDQKWLEYETRKIIKILQVDSLMSVPPIPILMPRSKVGLSMKQEEILSQIEKLVRTKTKEIEIEKLKKEIVQGDDINEEFRIIVNESKKNDNKGFETTENLSIVIPDNTGVDEIAIYDFDLINKVKTALKEWKTGWKEKYDFNGDEIEIENYIEKQPKVFISDKKIAINVKISVLLDLSSSIEDNEMEYKKATVALCEGLEYLGIKFSIYAFNTESRTVKCWVIKPPTARWGSIYARRLMQVKPVGGTPLAEIYKILQPSISAFKPDIFVTLTDGEPSDMDAVRSIVLSYKRSGVEMIAIGLGADLGDAIGIGYNLKYLNYQRILTLSKKRLQDLPKKVLGLLTTE